MTIPSKVELQLLYSKRALRYDLTANLYYFIGFREWAYREKAVQALGLGAGDTVVELGCGTGLNFGLLREAVGAQGRVIGVDLSPEMLEMAATRVAREGWSNVDLVHEDAGTFEYPRPTDGVISTFALTLVPEYDAVIAAAARALGPGRRMVVLDLKRPAWAPAWLVHLGVWLTAPFGVTRELTEQHPWESIARHFRRTTRTDLYAGFAYIAVGER